mgnify:CR=1 FL=1
MFATNEVPDGNHTAIIYGLIGEGKYGEAARVLQLELQNFPRSRAALSLLAFCLYYLQDFVGASQTYVARSGGSWRKRSRC